MGADHAAFQMKKRIKKYLEAAGYPVDDVGTWSEESVDYPDFARGGGRARRRARKRSRHPGLRHGNRHVHRREQSEGVRAALAHDSTDGAPAPANTMTPTC